ncbi:hypothetical protein HOLleu_03699 [Holothuria leucospilota]|uniref:Uncharacterized protein n=1 Tax=Holothuria leucospilota TaxID=206669 RepID=A0A9Q1CTX3_HOLLE|nr:hypothetical protein HOLleu_03699 [Holothuria leucospilota]
MSDYISQFEILYAKYKAVRVAVIYTACTRTVCGIEWLHNYTRQLDENDLELVHHSESSQEFCLGDGVNVLLKGSVVIPATIAETAYKIRGRVVDCDIPLLLSKESLKKQLLYYLSTDSATMFEKLVQLDFTSSGHYCISIQKGDRLSQNNSADEILVNSVSEQDWDRSKLIKVYKQFGHANSEKLCSLLRIAGVSDAKVFDLVTDVTRDCNDNMKDMGTAKVVIESDDDSPEEKDTNDKPVTEHTDDNHIMQSFDLDSVEILESVENLEPVAPEQVTIENCLIVGEMSIHQVKLEELQRWKEFSVYKKVPDQGQNASRFERLKDHHLGKESSLKLIVYSDASLGNLPDDGSQGGYFIFLAGDNGLLSPITWQSKRTRRAVSSTLAAETLAISDVVDTAIFIAILFGELFYGILDPKLCQVFTSCITNNYSVYETVHSTNHVKENRLRIEVTNMKELINLTK